MRGSIITTAVFLSLVTAMVGSTHAVTPQGDELVVPNVTGGTEEPQTSRSIGMAEDGSFVIGWHRGGKALVRLYGADGTASGDEIEVSLSEGHFEAVAMARNGSFVVLNDGPNAYVYRAEGTLLTSGSLGGGRPRASRPVSPMRVS
jgi:hypothetical protein